MQFKWVPTTRLYKEVDKKYTGCNLKTMELFNCVFDCALIGVCAVIRSNMVCWTPSKQCSKISLELTQPGISLE